MSRATTIVRSHISNSKITTHLSVRRSLNLCIRSSRCRRRRIRVRIRILIIRIERIATRIYISIEIAVVLLSYKFSTSR